MCSCFTRALLDVHHPVARPVGPEHRQVAARVLLQLEVPQAEVFAAARIAHDRGARVVLSVAPFAPFTPEQLWEHCAYLDGGVPAERLTLGVPFYGRSFAGATGGDGLGPSSEAVE